MADATRTIKIRFTTYRQLKVMAAEHGESLMDLVDRLVSQERENPKIAHNIAHSLDRSSGGDEDKTD